jgi:hypothetical protein
VRAAAVLSTFLVVASTAAAQASRPHDTAAAPHRAATPAVLCATLVDGPASLLHGAARYVLSEGMRLQPGDIVEVGGAGLVFVEHPDGAEIALAPSTRAMVMRGRTGPFTLFTLEGQLKAASSKAALPVEVQSSLGAVTIADAVGVVEISGEQESVFAESGTVTVTLGGVPPLKLRPGEFCSRRPGQKPAPAPRPPQEFIAALPRPFLDPLPARVGRFAGRQTPLGKPRPFTYAEVQAWLRASPPVRRVLASQWAAKAAEPSFRQALLANLPHHPEWDRVLFPEKYEKGKKLP